MVSLDHVQYSLSPLKHFYLISSTSAALSDQLLFRLWYRLYIVFIFLIPLAIVVSIYYVTFDRLQVSPFNFNTMYIYYLVLQYILMVYPIMMAKRMRINKLVRALQDLDYKMHFKDFELCKKIRGRTALWLTWLMASHVVIHVVLAVLLLQLPVGIYIVSVSTWFKFVEMAMDLELTGISCFAWLLYYRAQAFLEHLERIVKEQASSDLNLLVCHRQLHFVLKKINKAWKIQITVTMCIITFQVLRNLLSICVHSYDRVMGTICVLLLVRYLTVFLPLCVVGQRIANVFDQIHVTAGIMKDAGFMLSREFVRNGACMFTEGELRVRRLRGQSDLDAKLPLRLLATVGSLLIFILQLKVDFQAFDV